MLFDTDPADPDQRDRSVCRSKIQYATKAAARATRDKIRRDGSTASLYQCKVCHLFHITSKPQGHDRRNRRVSRMARDGNVVSLTYDANPGTTLEIGDGLITQSGRIYLIVNLRIQKEGKHVGRYHLSCVVNPEEIPAVLHPLVWNERGAKKVKPLAP